MFIIFQIKALSECRLTIERLQIQNKNCNSVYAAQTVISKIENNLPADNVLSFAECALIKNILSIASSPTHQVKTKIEI